MNRITPSTNHTNIVGGISGVKSLKQKNIIKTPSESQTVNVPKEPEQPAPVSEQQPEPTEKVTPVSIPPTRQSKEELRKSSDTSVSTREPSDDSQSLTHSPSQTEDNEISDFSLTQNEILQDRVDNYEKQYINKLYDRVQRRLNGAVGILNQLLDGNEFQSFFSLMIYMGKCYKNSRVISAGEAIASHLLDFGEGQEARILTLINRLTLLIGPTPSNYSSSYHSSRMVTLDVIPVGNTTYSGSSGNKDLFFCLLEKDHDPKEKVSKYPVINFPNEVDLFKGFDADRLFDITKDGFRYKSYIISYYRKTTTKDYFMSIRKYTDRITMRLKLVECFSRDEDKVEFALFVLENIDIIAINPDYIRNGANYVAFDLHSFITDLFSYYEDNNGSVLDYNDMTVNEKFTVNGKVNQANPYMGLKTSFGVVCDDSTIASLFWTYRLKYLRPTYYDRSWLSRQFRIRFNKDSSIGSLCHYTFQKIDVPMNVLTIDSDVDYGQALLVLDNKYAQSLEGYDPTVKEISEIEDRMDTDLKIYYDKLGDDQKNVIRRYLKWFKTCISNVKRYDIAMIYQLIYTIQSVVDKGPGKYTDLMDRYTNYMDILKVVSDKAREAIENGEQGLPPNSVLFVSLQVASPNPFGQKLVILLPKRAPPTRDLRKPDAKPVIKPETTRKTKKAVVKKKQPDTKIVLKPETERPKPRSEIEQTNEMNTALTQMRVQYPPNTPHGFTGMNMPTNLESFPDF